MFNSSLKILYFLVHLLMFVNSAGHVTFSKVIDGLSASWNHWNLNRHPFWSGPRIWLQSFKFETPPNRWPHPWFGAPHWDEQPLIMPTPPPGICKSKWFSPRFPPVLGLGLTHTSVPFRSYRTLPLRNTGDTLNEPDGTVLYS